MTDQLVPRGTLVGHKGWVTQIATTSYQPDMLFSASRDKTLMIWDLRREAGEYGTPVRSLHGHNHFVSDVVLSSDGLFALSGSWDQTLRLWDLNSGKTITRFTGHTNDVLSVSFSNDHRRIVSGSRDKTAVLWNTRGERKYVFNNDGHTDWVSCVRFSPTAGPPIVVTCGWDKQVKVWDVTDCALKKTHSGHTGYLNTVTVSPDGSLCASGGKDGQAMLWDLCSNKFLYTLPSGGIINSLCFSPNRYWLCAAVGSTIKIWDLENKVLADELKPESLTPGPSGKCHVPTCTCLTWSADGQTLFAGFTDNIIRVWQLTTAAY